MASDMNKENVRFFFLLFFLGVCFFLCWKIFAGFLEPLILAACLASVFSPLMKWFGEIFPGKDALNASLSCTVVVLLVVLPLCYLIVSFSFQAVSVYDSLNTILSGDTIGSYLSEEKFKEVLLMLPYGDLLASQMSFDPQSLLKSLLKNGVGLLSSSVGSLLGRGGSFLFGFAGMILALWLFFHAGEALREGFLKISPLSRKQEMKVVDEFHQIARTSFIGTFGTAGVQGIFGGILFWFYGFSPLLMGMLFAFASLIPVVGTSLVWGPVALYLLVTGAVWQGIVLILLGALIGFSDNLIRPFFMKGEGEIHPVLLFFSIIGGLSAFGFFGMVYGPIILAITRITLHIYYEEYGKTLDT